LWKKFINEKNMILLKRPAFFVLVPLLWSTSSAAADGYYHEILGSFNMLTSSLAPIPSQANRFGMGFGGGVGYAYHFNGYVSIRTGIHANYYQSTTGMSGISETSTIQIPDEWAWNDNPMEEKASFDFTSTLESYTAQQSVLYLQIPVIFECASLFPNLTYLGWYAAAGVKVGYSAMGSSDASIQNLASTVMINPDNVFLSNLSENDALSKYFGWGLSNVNENVKSKLDLGFSGIGYLEVGFTQQLTPRHTLYAGFFGEYNLYSFFPSSPASVMVEYEPLPEALPEETTVDKPYYHLRYNPAAHLSTSGVKLSHFLSVGVTLRIGFALNKKAAAKTNDRIFNIRYF
jgi:hypothetical protein